MVNKFFTLLNKGILNEYGRLVENGLYISDDKIAELHNTLVPTSDDKYSTLCTEQLLQIVLKSTYYNRLIELDPLNTYTRDVMNLEEDTYTVVNSNDLTYLVMNESSADPKWCEKNFSVVIDPNALTATVSSEGLSKIYTFAMNNNLSDKILLADEVYLRLQGVLPATAFTISVRYSQKFERDLITLLTALENLEIPWFNASYTDAFFQEDVSYNKLATVIMNLYEILTNGSNV